MEPEELTELALEAAVEAGAGYADVRWVREETEGLTVTDDRVDDLEAEDSSGLGVRVLVDGRGGWSGPGVRPPSVGSRCGRPRPPRRWPPGRPRWTVTRSPCPWASGWSCCWPPATPTGPCPGWRTPSP